MKFVKGKPVSLGAGIPVSVKIRPVEAGAGKPVKASENPWIDKRHFDTLMDRCVAAENMCKDLINIIAVDDGEFLAGHDSDYLQAGAAIKKGDV